MEHGGGKGGLSVWEMRGKAKESIQFKANQGWEGS